MASWAFNCWFFLLLITNVAINRLLLNGGDEIFFIHLITIFDLMLFGDFNQLFSRLLKKLILNAQKFHKLLLVHLVAIFNVLRFSEH
jgi:hypothetical protein